MKVIDISVLVAYFHAHDSCHTKALDLLCKCKQRELIIYDFIFAEVLNVFRAKLSEEYSRSFFNFISGFRIKVKLTSRNCLTTANFIFFKFPKLSYTDCLLIAAAKNSTSEILSFDKKLLKAWNELNNFASI